MAQDLATLDLISEGRIEVGIGAGWSEPEYAAAGITFDRPGVRIERMLEAVAVIRGLFADGPFSFSGRYYIARRSTTRSWPAWTSVCHGCATRRAPGNST